MIYNDLKDLFSTSSIQKDAFFVRDWGMATFVEGGTVDAKERVLHVGIDYTQYVTEDGTELKTKVYGVHEKETFAGYEYVTTRTEANGDTVHVYKKVVTPTTTPEPEQPVTPTNPTPTQPETPTHPTPTPLVDEPKLPPVVTPPQVGDIANTITYNRVAVRQVNTRWIDINGKELKTPVTDTTTKPAGDIDKYAFVESRTDDDGNVTHVFRQYTTKWVDESGTELKDMVTDKDTKEHGTIQDYAYVNSETDNNGNVTHIFRQYTTKWVDEDNKELKTPVTTDSVKEHGDIPEYAYVTTNTDEKGNVTHIFRQYTTEWVDEDGKELKDIVKGASPMPRGDEIKDYKFVESKTDEKGNVKHIFKQFMTRWVNTELEDLDDAVKTSEFKDAKTFENYQFVETREVGNTRTHIYRRYNTFWVEEKTNKELKKENKLVKEPGDIASYVYVRTETKENGDLVHVFKKIEQKPAEQSKKSDVPTGVKSNIILTGITLILSAFGITILNKKRREA